MSTLLTMEDSEDEDLQIAAKINGNKRHVRTISVGPRRNVKKPLRHPKKVSHSPKKSTTRAKPHPNRAKSRTKPRKKSSKPRHQTGKKVATVAQLQQNDAKPTPTFTEVPGTFETETGLVIPDASMSAVDTTSNKDVVAKPKGSKNTTKSQSRLLDLYTCFVEFLIYNTVYEIEDPANTVYKGSDHLQVLQARSALFDDECKRVADELTNELMIYVSQSTISDSNRHHPALTVLMMMYTSPEVHFEDDAVIRECIKAQGLNTHNVPVICAWCGNMKTKGPTKNMYRILINSNDDTTHANAMYMCKSEAYLFAALYNVLRFNQLITSHIQHGINAMGIRKDVVDLDWITAYTRIVGPRGEKKASTHKATGRQILRYKTPIQKWPSKIKKNSGDSPLVPIVAQWRDHLVLAERLLHMIKEKNKDEFDISINYQEMRQEAAQGVTEMDQSP